jgi:hypothetical protein
MADRNSGFDGDGAEARKLVAPVEDSLDSQGIERIVKMIEDPDTPIADITRLIALEIAGVMKKMTVEDPLVRGAVSQRDLNDRVKAYRELQRTLTESDALSRKDVLNLDGPKFKFVFMEIINLFQKAMKDAGVGGDLMQNTMLQFGDLVKANDDVLRRDLNRIER